MSEFATRMAVQRKILRAVNSQTWVEELFGLSSKAIERWAITNGLRTDSDLVRLLRTASEKLLFLATRSQEQVSDDYLRKSNDLDELTGKIAAVASDLANVRECAG